MGWGRGESLDGSETGWGRQGEPAPRWRALLDRARLGGRGAEHTDADRRVEESPVPPPDPLPRRGAGTGWTGRAAAVGRAADGSYGTEPGYRAEATFRVDPAFRADPRYDGEPAYRAEPAYRTDPDPAAEPSWRADPSYAPEPRAEPSWRAEPTYPAEPSAEPSWRADPAYPAEPSVEPSWRADPEPRGRVEAPVESRYSLLDGGYRPAAPPPESRYALLDRGRYRPEIPATPEQPVVPAPRRPVEGRPGRIDAARARWRAAEPDAELERATGVLRRELGTPRVLAFANPKGGVHKTTATVLAAASVGSVRGRGVLAWDDNELRGTLGLRAGSARHARTIRHLVQDLAQIEILEGDTLLSHLDDYLRHASDGSYDVLAGEESPRFAQRLDQFTVKRVLELLRRTHEVVCVDTGNNVESPNWRTVMQAADQLVVTTVPREDAAFSADWMLDLLHEVGMGELADNAVTLISCPTPGRSALQDDLERHFATRTRAVAVVPYDPALETGSSIEYPQLQAETRAAWLKAAAMMLEPFAR
ncbi:MinD-like ATPase involved in chromosome partitioning or flagellar assembly [Micromonospora humi]|uniref:MinD-like ATPase involved in chromosome partitioning or flagellar assembly n=1 Tax=Micromonospora humi TaxID=745366 RepID=A0A1C5HP33_9ACTN|nr:ATPase [Micromonospora humi]SCG47667.1 MinD-like ATPase involved in chromosome partitioning or flagellar assembly [Micromonospora humi]